MTPLAPSDAAADARTREVVVQRVRGAAGHEDDDRLAVEEPLEIRLQFHDGERARIQPLSVTMRTPGHDAELAVGFLVSEGVVRVPGDVADVRHCPTRLDQPSHNVLTVRLADGAAFDPARLERHFYTTSSCGVCGKTSLEALEVTGCPVLGPGPALRPEVIHSLPATLRAAQSVFDETGGLHAAALFDADGRLLRLREDVGRHNAVDKLVGSFFLEGRLPLSDA
ncbi:MAG TPA: formate dehydrogenase accessory sulfurtransferase FdhD, partial [Rhodothermales bacterium]|nr:formate dehydrogenase accessory sulfurtransferase FdhD [Rhodothermales bacterium]